MAWEVTDVSLKNRNGLCLDHESLVIGARNNSNMHKDKTIQEQHMASMIEKIEPQTNQEGRKWSDNLEAVQTADEDISWTAKDHTHILGKEGTTQFRRPLSRSEKRKLNDPSIAKRGMNEKPKEAVVQSENAGTILQNISTHCTH